MIALTIAYSHTQRLCKKILSIRSTTPTHPHTHTHTHTQGKKEDTSSSYCCGPSSSSTKKNESMTAPRKVIRTKKTPIRSVEKYETRDVLRDMIGELKRYQASLGTNEIIRREYDFDSDGDEDKTDFDHVKVSYLPPLQSLSADDDDVGLDESDAFSGTFRLTPDYTFGMLLEDACLFFGIPSREIQTATLRDENASLWPHKARVRNAMRKAIKSSSSGFLPQIRLVLPQTNFESKDDSSNDEIKTNVFDLEAYMKPSRIKKRRLRDRENRMFKITTKKTPFLHDDTQLGNSIMEAYGYTYEDPSCNEGDASDLKYEIHTRMHSACWGLVLHIIFTLTLLYPLIRGRGNVYEQNDIKYNLNNIIRRNFATTSGSGSAATIANISTLQTTTHVMDFLKGPVLNTIFQCGMETQGGSCDSSETENSSSFTQFTILGNLELLQYRTLPTLGRSEVDSVGCQGKMGTRPQLYYLFDSTSVDRTAFEYSSLRCYSGYDPKFADTTQFGINNFTYDSDYRGNGFESDRAVYLSDGFNQNLGVHYSTALETLNTLSTSGWIDKSTRMLEVRTVLFHRNYQMTVVVQIAIETPPSGAVDVTPRFGILRLTDFNFGHKSSTLYVILILCDVYILLYVASMLYRIVAKIRIFGPWRVFRVGWNIMDVLLVILVLSGMMFSRYRESHYKSLYDTLVLGDYNEAIDQATNQRRNLLWLSLAISLSMFSLLKFVQGNSMIEHVWRIFTLVFNDIVAVMTVFFLYLIGLAMMCHIRCAIKIQDFSTLQSSLLIIFREIFGGHLDDNTGETIWYRIQTHFPLFFIFVRFFMLVAKYTVIYLLTALMLSAYIRVKWWHRRDAERDAEQEDDGVRKWRPHRISTREFWKHYLLGFFLAKRKKEKVSSKRS